MVIRTIWVQYMQSYEGQYMPNIVDAWDEYALDENWEGFEESLQKHKAMIDEVYSDVKVLVIRVPDDVVTSLFRTPPTVDVEVVHDDE